MKILKALLLGFVFVLSTNLCYAESEMKFNYFSACAYDTEGDWEAFVLTELVDDSGAPVEGAVIKATWDNSLYDMCKTDKKGNCKFHIEGLNENQTIFIVNKVEKKDYVFDNKNTSIMVMKP